MATIPLKRLLRQWRAARLPVDKNRIADLILAALEPNLNFLAHRITPMPGIEVDDLKQAARLDIVQAIAQYDPRVAEPETFFTRIAEREMKNAIRSHYRKTHQNVPLDEARSTPNDSNWVADADRRLMIEAALTRLPPDLAQIIRLRYFEGYTLQETGEKIGCGYMAVFHREQKALARLQMIIGESFL